MVLHQQAMKRNPLHCLYDGKLICIWWNPCWLPEKVSVLLRSYLTSTTVSFFFSWKNFTKLFWLEIIIFIFISSSLMYATISQTCLTIGITSSDWKMEILRFFLWRDWPFRSRVFPETNRLKHKCPRWILWSSKFGTHWNVTSNLVPSHPTPDTVMYVSVYGGVKHSKTVY